MAVVGAVGVVAAAAGGVVALVDARHNHLHRHDALDLALVLVRALVLAPDFDTRTQTDVAVVAMTVHEGVAKDYHDRNRKVVLTLLLALSERRY